MKIDTLLAWFLALCTLIFADWNPAPTIIRDPVPLPPTQGINVTRAEYESAFAKWQAAGAEQYKMVVYYSDMYKNIFGTWTLRVNGKSVEILNSLKNGVPSTREPSVTGEKLQHLAIEAMFATIRKVLDDPSQAVIEIGGTSYAVRYTVAFDETLGYPKSFSVNPISITDSDSQIIVKSLEIETRR